MKIVSIMMLFVLLVVPIANGNGNVGKVLRVVGKAVKAATNVIKKPVIMNGKRFRGGAMVFIGLETAAVIAGISINKAYIYLMECEQDKEKRKILDVFLPIRLSYRGTEFEIDETEFDSQSVFNELAKIARHDVNEFCLTTLNGKEVTLINNLGTPSLLLLYHQAHISSGYDTPLELTNC